MSTHSTTTMFSNLIESSADRFGWLKHPWVIGISLAAHVLLLGGVFWAAAGTAEPPEKKIDPKDITYIDVSEVPPPPEMPEPEPEPEKPEPQPKQPEPKQPSAPTPRPPRITPPEVTEPEKAAGTQELQPPKELAGVPEPAPSQEPVKAEDFGGRGEIGGVAGGKPPEETGSGGGGAGEGTGGTYTANMVDRTADLSNRSSVANALKRYYPENLRDAGIAGRVVVQFVVLPNGRVEGSSVRIISSSNPAFVEPTKQAVDLMRFRPAKKGSNNVRQLVRMPIEWKPES